MAKYDGLIIPRSYNDYINKSDPLAVAQALQLTGVMDNVPTAQSTKPAKSGGIFAASAVIMANSATLSGVAISAGSVVRVMFTAALTGSDATTGLTLTYNGTAYAVKAGKDGALVALTAHLIEESYIYLQAYTTLELAFDGSQFVVMGNPVVISNADFSIMADGYIAYKTTIIDRNIQVSGNGTVYDFINRLIQLDVYRLGETRMLSQVVMLDNNFNFHFTDGNIDTINATWVFRGVCLALDVNNNVNTFSIEVYTKEGSHFYYIEDRPIYGGQHKWFEV